MYNSSILIFHVHVVLTSSAAVVHPASLGHTCYLELAHGFTYTLHVSPPRDGGPRAIPEVLKGPPHVLLGVCAILLRLFTSMERLKRVYISPGTLLEIYYFT
jgi:hypothetical protein